MQHSERKHARWSASATARLLACPGSFWLAEQVPSSPEREDAAWGTACHELSELCLNGGHDPFDFIGKTYATKEHVIPVDEAMAETAKVYIDYINERRQLADWCVLEQKFSLAKINPPLESGGTADAVLYYPGAVLEVVDLKSGRWAVDPDYNPQLLTYALGALLAYPGLSVDVVKLTIVQPRAISRQGAVWSVNVHPGDLAFDWAQDLIEGMHKALQPNAPRVPGKHCKFCPAAGVCTARADKELADARVFFDDQNVPQIPNRADTLSREELAQILDAADSIEDWLKAVRSYAKAQVEAGESIPGYMLVDKRATRKWEDPEEVIRALVGLTGRPAEDFYSEPKPKTPAQVEKLLGKAGKEVVAGLSVAESSGTNLVRADKTTRPPAKSKAEHFFTIETQE